ncbi:unnamed protein product [Caenorhabditis auriculariae]|uniref:Receptor L-domain domain-containing protein n=1 Tax=Caenorhabditis auriculariae TaxID=2777116 RepID=A0A8S1HSE5_9PELO|nr:unnamed protein product [Caenorhabditis auriculariae]
MRARLKTSSPPVVKTIFLLLGILLTNLTPTTAQTSCCDMPIFGTGNNSCVDGSCLACTRSEFVVKKQGDVSGNALGATAYLASASRIVLENNPGIANFIALRSLVLDASDSLSFPEPLIRVRNAEVSEESFSNLKTITITPIDPYCTKKTILDIDNMKKKPWDRLRKLEKDLLASCPKPTTQAPPPATAPNLPPNSAPSSPQNSGPLPKPISAQSSSCPPVPECPSIPSAEKATEGMPIMTIAITSLCWIVIFGLVLALTFLFLKRKAPPSTGFEKEFEEYAQCVSLMASYVHNAYYSMLSDHVNFVKDTIDCLTAYEQQTGFCLEKEGRMGSKLDKMEGIFDEVERRRHILDQGGTLEKTKLMENVAYKRANIDNNTNYYDEVDGFLLLTKFIESKKGIKCTDTVEILVPNQDGLSKEVLKKEKDKARKKGGKEVKKDTKKGYVDEEKKEKRQKAGVNLELSVKTQEKNIKRNEKIPEIAKHLDNTVAKWMNTKPKTEEEKKIADAWLSLGVIDRLLTEFADNSMKIAKNYNGIRFQLCRIVMNVVKERTLINNEQAYASENRRGTVKDIHEFIHVLEHLYTDEDPEAQKLKDFLTLYEWIRFLDLHYMGLDYNEYKGSLVYVRPSPMDGEPFIESMLRLERYEKDYDMIKAEVEKYCKKKKIRLVCKANLPKQSKIRDNYDFEKYQLHLMHEPAGICEMKAEDAAKAVKAREDEKIKKQGVSVHKSLAAQNVMSKNGAAPKSGAPPKSSAPKSSSAEPTPTSMK